MSSLRVGLAIGLGCGLMTLTSCTGKPGDVATDSRSKDTPSSTTNSPKSATPNPETAPAEASKSATEKPATGTLAGEYCYGTHNDTLTAIAQINIQGAQVTGDLKGTVHNKKESYFTSYRQTATGKLVNDQAQMQIKTEIENDKQSNEETWTIRDRSLKTQRETFERIDCSELDKWSEKAKDAMKPSHTQDTSATAPKSDTGRIEFAPGSSAATVKGAIVRGEQKIYLLNAAKGQKMTMKVTSPEDNAVFGVIGPDGQDLLAEESNTSLVLPATGDYQVVVGSMRGNASYELTVGIK
jgi:hypothetical protein